MDIQKLCIYGYVISLKANICVSCGSILDFTVKQKGFVLSYYEREKNKSLSLENISIPVTFMYLKT